MTDRAQDEWVGEGPMLQVGRDDWMDVYELRFDWLRDAQRRMGKTIKDIVG